MALTHLLRSLILGRDPESVHAALMLTAYFDESGHRDEHQTVVMAGFVASIRQWEAFDAAWKKALGDIPYFHMKEFVRKDHPFYADWDAERRTRFMTGLVDAMLLLPQSFGTGITMASYDEANKFFWLDSFIGKPWTVCAMSCIGFVEQWHKKKAKDCVEYIFHRVPPKTGQGKLRDLMLHQGLLEPVFRPAEKLSGLQAADLLAWEYHRQFEAMETDTFYGDFRIPYARLYEKFYKHWYLHAGFTPIQLCIDNNVPVREPGVRYVKRKGEWWQQRRVEK